MTAADTEDRVATLHADADILVGLETEALRCMFSGDQPGADRIRKAHARLKAFRAVNDDAAKLIGQQRQTISELREALTWLVQRDDYHRQEGMTAYESGSPTDRAFRAARAALAKAQPGETT